MNLRPLSSVKCAHVYLFAKIAIAAPLNDGFLPRSSVHRLQPDTRKRQASVKQRLVWRAQPSIRGHSPHEALFVQTTAFGDLAGRPIMSTDIVNDSLIVERI
jgi:hypothetical protein